MVIDKGQRPYVQMLGTIGDLYWSNLESIGLVELRRQLERERLTAALLFEQIDANDQPPRSSG
jgi:hypothetical protein